MAMSRLRGFLDTQTQIHHSPELGDKRRKGTVGSHNASVVEGRWPLRYSARPHSEVMFKPLSIGWMESKGSMDVSSFISHCITSDPHLKRHAQTLQNMSLCPLLEDSTGLVLSVHPLSNGYESRSTSDCQEGVLLECTSDKDEATCRNMLTALIADLIQTLEAPSEGGVAVQLLVEPVEVVCAWNQQQQLAIFPTYDELESLPPLPAWGEETKVAKKDTSAFLAMLDDDSDSSS